MYFVGLGLGSVRFVVFAGEVLLLGKELGANGSVTRTGNELVIRGDELG
jgi:hypothetical protein